jgi:ABC-type sugar transport system permease subunit
MKRGLRKSPWFVVAIFMLPSLLGFTLFLAIPAVESVFFSFTNFSGGPNFKFLGFTNYINAFASTNFRHNIWVTAVFTFWSVILQLGLGLAFALFLNAPMHARSFLRGTMFVPNVLSSVAIGLIFGLIFDADRGPLNQFLVHMGIPAPRWLAGTSTALLTIILVTTWQNFGYWMVLFLGGLQSVSSTHYEAAAIDGAGPVRRFFAVTLPGLSPIIFFALTMCIIRAFQVFDQIFVMTGGQSGGGPAGATSVLVFDIYQSGFSQFRFGYASAESVVLLVIVLVITLLQQMGQNKWVTYDIV